MRIPTAVFGLLLYCWAPAAQPPKKGPPPSSPKRDRPYVREGFAINPFIIENDCIGDVLSAHGLTGVERRKKLLELLNYGCMKEHRFVYRVTTLAKREAMSASGDPVIALNVFLAVDPEYTLLSGEDHDPDKDDEPLTVTAWIMSQSFLEARPEELIARLRRMREAKQK